MILSSALSAKAPIADIITSGDSLAAIYSMFRLRSGYTGACRRVKRLSDNATRDVGFTAGGYYNLKDEVLWAAGSDTVVDRWYNQSSQAGISLPSYLQAPASLSPIATTSGSPVLLAGHPAIELRQDAQSMTPNAFGNIGVESSAGFSTVSAVWIGRGVYGTGGQAFLFSLNPDEYETPANIIESSPDELVDPGPYVGRDLRSNHTSADFSSPTLYVASYQVESPSELYLQEGWNNGGSSPAQTSDLVSSIALGRLELWGPSVIHTMIVDGAASLAIHDAAKATFNRTNWIY